jgi:malonyl-CoA O-methyltransferase
MADLHGQITDANAQIVKATVRAHFSRAANSYSASAILQKQVEARLLESLQDPDLLGGKLSPAQVLDLGCGPGLASKALRALYPQAQLLALDFALPMLQQLQNPSRWNPFAAKAIERINGDAQQLPLVDQCIDLLFSSLCIQWIQDLDALLAEWRRVLRPGAQVLLSTFGPDTLKELRAAWASVDDAQHVNRFLDMHDIGDALVRHGFQDAVLETEHFHLQYASPQALMRELKDIGATNAAGLRMPGLGGRTRMRAMLENYPLTDDFKAPATYEVIFATVRAPAAGVPIRTGAGEIASVPIHAIRRPVKK